MAGAVVRDTLRAARPYAIASLALAALAHAAWAAPALRAIGPPSNAASSQARLLTGLPASVVAWISSEAQAVAGGAALGAVPADVARQFPPVTRPADQSALVFLVLMQADTDVDQAIASKPPTTVHGAVPGVGYVNAPANATNAAANAAPTYPPWQDNATTPWGAAANIQVVPATNTPPRQAVAASAWGSPAGASDLSQATQLDLQQLTSQKQEIEDAVSNVMKSMSDTSSTIVANLKD